MAGKKTANKVAPAAVAAVGLAAIVAATQGEAGFLFAPIDEANALVAEGLIEVNPKVPNTPTGQIAARATPKGIERAQAEASDSGMPAGGAPAWGSPGVQAPEASAEAEGEEGGEEGEDEGEFVIEDNIEIPEPSGRGGRTGSSYPFEKLNVGQSFFVAKPSKNLASTVSSANARYSEIVKDDKGNTVMTKDKKQKDVPLRRQTRQFIVRAVTEKRKDASGNEIEVKGSRIWRVAPKAA